MELMQEVKDNSSHSKDQEEEESSSKQLQHCPFSSPSFSLSSSPSTTHHQQHHHHHDVTTHQNPWLGTIHHDHHHHHSPDSHNSSSRLGFLQHHNQDTSSSNFTNQTNLKQIDFMELSLGNNNKDVVVNDQNQTNFHAPSSSTQEQQQQPSEKEHMFDKVVTPSDVGKLNRLVIPKQHAEKYFPLDSTSNEKGLLLNFEDRNGKLWRFRYSYWNSSQSYVMTKGWSRFVKEKKLDAGDIVSFQRGVGELYRHRLFIDWRRRINHNHNVVDPLATTCFTPFFLPNQQQYSIRWGGTNSRFYSLPYPSPQQQQMNYNYNYNMYPFHQHGGGNYHHNHHHDPSSLYYMRSSAAATPMQMVDQGRQQHQQEGGGVGGGGGANVSNMIIDSVPISHNHYQHGGRSDFPSSGNLTSTISTSTNNNGAAKRLRLFGVNMECGSSSSSSPSLQHLKVPHHHEETISTSTTRFEDNKRGEASMIFGLDPSLQYHNYQQQ